MLIDKVLWKQQLLGACVAVNSCTRRVKSNNDRSDDGDSDDDDDNVDNNKDLISHCIVKLVITV